VNAAAAAHQDAQDKRAAADAREAEAKASISEAEEAMQVVVDALEVEKNKGRLHLLPLCPLWFNIDILVNVSGGIAHQEIWWLERQKVFAGLLGVITRLSFDINS